MPQLETACVLTHVVTGVVSQPLQLVRRARNARLCEDRARGVHKQLQGRQSLLTVDHVPRCEVVAACLVRLQNHRAEEVLRVEVRLAHPQLSNPPDVAPQRLPLVGFVPHVWPLKERDDEVLRKVEQLQRRAFKRLHRRLLQGS